MKLIAGTTPYSENPNVEYIELTEHEQECELTLIIHEMLANFPKVRGIVILGEKEAVVYKLES